MTETLGFKVNPRVFWVSVLVIVAFLAVGVGFPAQVERAFEAIQATIAQSLGWYYVLVVGVFLVFVVWIGASRFGHLRLGEDDEQPRYRYVSWFAMLFTAGMGIGLVFWSVAEPLSHLASPPRAEPNTPEAATEAMRWTFFHWGLHAWAVYLVVGLSLAYFAYRRGLPLSMRSALYPLIGDRINGWAGDAVDIFAVFGTMFGVATSLGLGILQVNAGLASIGLVEQSLTVQLVLITAVTAGALASLLAGLDKGILRLSVTNLALGGVLLLFVAAVGPTLFALGGLVEQLGVYLQTLPETTLWTETLSGTGEWQIDWTIFYWGWWISWSPFVGLFIARVSRGRSIREFVFGVLLVPAGFTFVWLAVFGNTAFAADAEAGGAIADAVAQDPAIALFALLDTLPLTLVMSLLAILLIAVYFVTSSDSASLVIDQLTKTPGVESPRRQRAFWAVLEGAVAAVLLIAGGLGALQTAAITTAVPFSLIMLIAIWGLIRAVYADYRGAPLASIVLIRPGHQRVPDYGEDGVPWRDIEGPSP